MAALGRFGKMLWNVDGIRITRVVEHVMPFAVDFFAEATPKDVAAEPWLVPDFVDPHGRYLMSFHTFVIEAGGRCIVVDTCTGNSKDRPLIPEFDHQRRPFLADLAAAGFVPENVIRSSARTCTSITSAGTRSLWAADGVRRPPARATCSGRLTSTTGRVLKILCTSPLSRTRCSR